MPEGKIDRVEARQLRADGWMLKDIAARYGASIGKASKACAGVVCPVNHTIMARPDLVRAGRAKQLAAQAKKTDALRQAALELRRKGLSNKSAGGVLGISGSYVSRLTSPYMADFGADADEAVEAPSWVKGTWLIDAWDRVILSGGDQHDAASHCRRLKAEAAASCR